MSKVKDIELGEILDVGNVNEPGPRDIHFRLNSDPDNRRAMAAMNKNLGLRKKAKGKRR